MKVAIQGELGSFSHEAAGRMAPRAKVLPLASSREVFEAVRRRRAAAAVVPIENSLAGSVAEHFDLLLASGLFVRQEFRLRIVHNLIASPGVKLKDVREVLSHPVALAQCRDFLGRQRGVRPVPFYDTAGAVQHVVQNKLQHAAAIAGRLAAAEYGGAILKAGIEDDKQNFTRFFLIGRERGSARGANKTSLAFSVKNVPGALFQALSVFALRDISLAKIESRPVRGRPWEYVFYADILRGDDETTRTALRQLGEIAESVKVLGSYAAAK